MADLNQAKEVAQRLRATTIFGFGHQVADTMDALIMEVIEWRLPENNGAWERAENQRLRDALEQISKLNYSASQAVAAVSIARKALKGNDEHTNNFE